MAKKRAPRPRFDAETIRACGELLRYVDESRSLRANAIVAKISPSVDHRDIATAVRSVLDELSLRQREIIVRCDVRGESYASVAEALHVSERHLFRERRAGLSCIAYALLNQGATDQPSRVAVGPDAVEVTLAFSDALENSGNWQAAAESLERLATELAAPEQRGAIEIRLARLYRSADHLTPAFHHADLARTLAARATVDADLQRVEADIAIAAVTMCSGDWKLAGGLAQQSIAQLRLLTDRSFGSRVPNALAQALLLRAEMLVDNDDVASAYELASEASSIVGRNAADSVLAIGSREMAALTSLFLGKDVRRCAEELRDCCRAALTHGLIRESLTIATHLSVHYRLSGRPAEALRVLEPLLDTTRTVGVGWVKAAILCELIHANLDTGKLTMATTCAAELGRCSPDNVFTRAWMEISQARLYLAGQEFVRALEAAEAAERRYAGIAPGRYVGIALRMQSEALYGIGEFDLARRTISRAIDSLKSVSNPRPLAIAYRVMAAISGSSRYANMAQKLLREVSVSSQRSSD
jgi:tetratricopeptide (TPR) repeat protein